MPTIKDVAQRANTSVSTVSIILNGRAKERKISQETQARVTHAIAELGYTPNRGARNLRAAVKKPTVALFWAMDWRSVMLARFLQGLERGMSARKTSFEIIIQPYPTGQLAEQQSLAGVPSFDAIIVGNASAADLTYLRGHRPPSPIVLYNRRLEGFRSTYVDDEEVGALAAKALSNSRHVLALTAQTSFSGLEARDKALMRHLKDLGIDVTFFQIDAMTPRAGYDKTMELLGHHEELFDAIFAPSDSVAFGALRACSEIGLKTPENVQVLAVGNGIPEYAEYSTPSLSTIEIPIEEMASRCLDAVIDELVAKQDEADNSPSSEQSHHQLAVAPRMVVRESLRIEL